MLIYRIIFCLLWFIFINKVTEFCSFANKFFSRQEIIFLTFNFNKRCKNKIENNNENDWSLLSYTVSYKIDFTTFGLHRDHLPVLRESFVLRKYCTAGAWALRNPRVAKSWNSEVLLQSLAASKNLTVGWVWGDWINVSHRNTIPSTSHSRKPELARFTH